jgi:CHAT domain-containing protein
MLNERRAAAPARADELLAFVSPEPLPLSPDTAAPLSPLASLDELFSDIAGLYPHATVRSGRDATAAALLAMGATGAEVQPAVLHFGTHAFVSPRESADPLESFIAPARTGGDGVSADGRLRARDILGRRIPGDIAVLAACTTGRGRVTGDGVVGLSRAFLTAGPTTLVLTVSAVDPHSSLVLMFGFHARLRGGPASRAQALAEAQRQLLAEGEPAVNWSSFVLFGAP